ncbi:MAG: glycoside hydrolase family 38 C-terminal domain-containing protein [Terriglobales bacterium]
MSDLQKDSPWSAEADLIGRRGFISTAGAASLAALWQAALWPEALWPANSSGSVSDGHGRAATADLPEVLRQLQAMTRLELTTWRYHPPDLPHGEAPALDDAAWPQVQVGRGGGHAPQGAHHGAGWYRAWVTIPRELAGERLRGARLQFVLRGGPRVRLFFDGGLVEQGPSEALAPVPFAEKARPGDKILVAILVQPGADGHGYFAGAGLLAAYPRQAVDPGVLRDELAAAAALIAGLRPPAARQRALDAAVAALSFSQPTGETAADPISNAALLAAQREIEALRPWMKQYKIWAVGNSHIDLAWLWPWTEALAVVRDTFTTVLQLMREYPGFIYTQSSSQDFAWLEHRYPPLFAAIQQRVKEGRWEMVGGMWVEPDLNMPDGESLVRQLLLGKRYIQSRFGVDVRVGWNPDSFGYSWQLAQIYKRSGVDYFVTQKLMWNDTTPPPHHLFWWEAPDGSRVLTYFPHGYANGTDPVEMARILADYAPETGIPEMMHLYGVGDHGGGPTRRMLDDIQRWKQPAAVFPELQYSTAGAFFAEVEKRRAAGLRIPVWRSELYLQYHRGTYTTQSETKQRVRRTEVRLHNAERYSALAMQFTARPYPQAELEDAWRRLLFDQFHDMMAGSGIAVNYREAAENLRIAGMYCEQATAGSLAGLAALADTRGPAGGVAAVIFNPHSWPRTDPVELEVELPAPAASVRVTGADGRELPSQVVARDDRGQGFRLLVIAGPLPPLGYEVVQVAPGAPGPAAGRLRAARLHLENEFLSLRLNPRNGNIASLVDKATGREAFAPGAYHGRVLPHANGRPAWAAPLRPLPAEGNVLQFFQDQPEEWDAWNIQANYEKFPLGPVTLESIELAECGPARAAIRVVRKFQSSRFVQQLRIYPGVPRVDVHTAVDWREQHVLCKAAFPLATAGEQATYEIPYGTIGRPTNPTTPAAMAEWEVCAQTWADLSGPRRGFALLNDSKFGYDCHGNVLRLTLLRSPTWPDPHADQGRHEFTYALLPHAGGWRRGGVMRQGHQLNSPLLAVAAGQHEGPWPARRSFASIAPDYLILKVIKKAEDDDALILRLYEFHGRGARARIRLPARAARVAEVNLMERGETPVVLSPDRQTVSLAVGPYEIRTLKMWPA